MATADIWVEVPPNPAADGRPAQTAAVGLAHVHLTNFDNTGVVSWAWTVVDAPPGTTATISNPAIANPTYGPLDVEGTYHLRLAVNGATGDWISDAEVDEIVVRVPNAIGVIYPAIGETVQGGTQGWADWLTCMNLNLQLLSNARTLQATYDASNPPRIDISVALGELVLRAGAAGTLEMLRIQDIAPGFATRFLFYRNGLMRIDPATGISPAGLIINGANNAQIFSISDSVLGGTLRFGGNGTCSITTTAALAAAARLWYWTPTPAATDVDSSILSYCGGAPVRNVWTVLGCGSARLAPGANGVVDTATASRSWNLLDLAYHGNVLVGKTRYGYRVDGTGITTDVGGTLYGFLSDLNGTVNGSAICYQAWTSAQSQSAYRVKTGALGSNYVGYCRFSAADVVAPTGASQWSLTVFTATGAASYWSANNGSIFMVIPVHVPPGSIITAASLHVLPGGLLQMDAFLVSTDALSGGSADQQTRLANAASDGTANEQDITMSGLTVVVPRGEAATQQAYYIVIESAQNLDRFYDGYVKFEYSELLHGE